MHDTMIASNQFMTIISKLFTTSDMIAGRLPIFFPGQTPSVPEQWPLFTGQCRSILLWQIKNGSSSLLTHTTSRESSLWSLHTGAAVVCCRVVSDLYRRAVVVFSNQSLNPGAAVVCWIAFNLRCQCSSMPDGLRRPVRTGGALNGLHTQVRLSCAAWPKYNQVRAAYCELWCQTLLVVYDYAFYMLIIYVISSLMGISLAMTSSPLPLTLVNAFIRLTFFPLPLHIRHGSSATGYVNVTVLDTDYHSNDAYTLHGYCTNKQIATMSGSDPRINFLPEGPSWFIFNITVYGIRLGKTNIRFYISKNLTESFQRRDPDMAPDEQRTKGL
ncbi:hypothetical protein LSH36_293g03044 [Paralvinella palmiformis]|uniref:Uncharacterized protein n=1 Tax=Paralvinella palmiformis TaxID=53620 RepID=A0AAD9JIC1_9ANNE|nr:hypothetical protein LSH36_293g03044 [Paralvinella palmiformis]